MLKSKQLMVVVLIISIIGLFFLFSKHDIVGIVLIAVAAIFGVQAAKLKRKEDTQKQQERLNQIEKNDK